VGLTILIVLGACIPVVLACGGILLALLLPAVQAAREAARRAQCMNNLRQIASALLNYESAHGRFPAAGATGKDGKPMQSWRVAILPYVERNDLYEKYDPKEPWNSPKNQAIAASMPAYYRCPSDPKASPTSQQTSYVMIAGEGGVEARGTDYIAAHSGTSDTILVIEVPDSEVHWMDPPDMTIDEIIERIKRRDRRGHPGGFNVAFCDGHTQFIRDDIAPETLRALANPNRKEPVDPSKF
jgi:prepilin-type processing-associated H-X9-DG protein